MKVVTIVGARPQFVKLAPVSRELRRRHEEVLVHTGQHYDHDMSEVFFQELAIPQPDVNLAIGSGSQAAQTGAMLAAIEQVLLREKPDHVLVIGDTNSTLAGALAAAKLGFSVGHIEAGLRSFNRAMPEEINRVVTDHLSDLLFCPTDAAVELLSREGITEGVHQVGDVMYDAFIQNSEIARKTSNVLERLGVCRRKFALVTIHRPANTDDGERLSSIMQALNNVDETVIFPLHPRTRAALLRLGISLRENVRAIAPLGYLDMLALEGAARLIATDSGGVQREAYFAGTPCLTLRDESEWPGTVEAGWNRLVGSNRELITRWWTQFVAPTERPPLFGDGTASRKIVETLESHT